MNPLFATMFDDAAIFPPGDAPMDVAVPAHAAHRAAWYARCVGPFVCADTRLDELAAQTGGLAEPLGVSLTVPGGATASAESAHALGALPGTRLDALEVRLGTQPLGEAVAALADATVPVFVEIPAGSVDAAAATTLREAGRYLKLRTGGTRADAFPTQTQLAAALGHAVRAGLRFKCTAGLHNAVRHRDPVTGFEHHGFCNVVLATHAALNGADPRPWLAEQDVAVITKEISGLGDEQVTRIRALFASFGTCSVTDPITDLTEMGLVNTP